MFKKTLTSIAVVAIVSATFAAAPAQAWTPKPWWGLLGKPQPKPHWSGMHHHNHGPNWVGPLTAGLVGAAAIGAIAAANSGDCYYMRRAVRDEDGYVIGYRKVRVCE